MMMPRRQPAVFLLGASPVLQETTGSRPTTLPFQARLRPPFRTRTDTIMAQASRLGWAGVFLAVLAPANGQTPPAGATGDGAGIAFFEKRIRPLLVQHCYSCHSAQAPKLKGGLRLDSREGLLKGGASGPAIIPGKPADSL